MISVPPNLQAQLGEAISLIADSDFWDRWDTLVDVCNIVLQDVCATVNSLSGSCLTPDTG